MVYILTLYPTRTITEKKYIKALAKIIIIIIVSLFANLSTQAQNTQLAKLKYSGGGDWYVSPTALTNVIKFTNENLGTNINPKYATIEPNNKEIFNYPFIFLTGHGNVVFSDNDAENLRNYLLAGGFLFINDSYGMDKFIRSQIKKIFPELELVEIPFSHPVYNQKYKFNKGLPKIHEHDGLPPKGLGIVYKGKLVLFYAYESDIGDGWEDPSIHNDPEELRILALQMGASLISYAFTSGFEQ